MKKKGTINLLIVFTIVFAGTFTTVKLQQYKQKTTFTQEKWAEDPHNRFIIVSDLVRRHDFSSMTREQVIGILGEPEKKGCVVVGLPVRTYDRDKAVDLEDPNCICYLTKTGQIPEECSGFYIQFDESGKVVDYAVIHFTT